MRVGAKPAKALRTTLSAADVSWLLLKVVAGVLPLVTGGIVWGPRFTSDVFYSVPHLVLGALVSSALIAWLVAVFRREVAPRVTWVSIALVALFILAILSTITSLYPPLALFGDVQDTGSLLAWTLFVAVAALATQLVDGPRRLESLAKWLVGGAGVLAAITLIQRLTGVDPMGLILSTDSSVDWMMWRGTGTLGNPDFVGNYLALVAPLSLVLAVRSLANTRTSPVVRYSLPLTFALIMIGAIGSLARGAWLALAVGVVVAVIAIRRSDSKQLRTAAILVVVALLLGIGSVIITSAPEEDVVARLGVGAGSPAIEVSQLQTLDRMLSGRYSIWLEAARVATERPLLGVGPANYRLGWYPVQGISGLELSASSMTGDPHSVPLLAAATLGIPAALILLAIAGTLTQYSLRSALKSGRGDRLVYAGWSATLVAALIAGVNASTTLPFLLAAGLTIGVVSAPMAEMKRVPRTAVSAATALMALSAVVLTTGMVPIVNAEIQAKNAFAGGDLAALERASNTAPTLLSLRTAYLSGLNSATLQALALGQAGEAEVEQAVSVADSLIADAPYDYEPLREKAFLLIGARQFSGDRYTRPALDAIEAARAVSPIALDLRTQEAALLIELGDTQSAVDALEAVWDRDPTDDLAGATYVDALRAAGRTDDAYDALELLEQRFPESAAVSGALARLESAGE